VVTSRPTSTARRTSAVRKIVSPSGLGKRMVRRW
jgi:hypothetical protein